MISFLFPSTVHPALVPRYSWEWLQTIDSTGQKLDSEAESWAQSCFYSFPAVWPSLTVWGSICFCLRDEVDDIPDGGYVLLTDELSLWWRRMLYFVVQSCLTFFDLMDCSLPNSSVRGFSRKEHWRGLPCPPRWRRIALILPRLSWDRISSGIFFPLFVAWQKDGSADVTLLKGRTGWDQTLNCRGSPCWQGHPVSLEAPLSTQRPRGSQPLSIYMEPFGAYLRRPLVSWETLQGWHLC